MRDIARPSFFLMEEQIGKPTDAMTVWELVGAIITLVVSFGLLIVVSFGLLMVSSPLGVPHASDELARQYLYYAGKAALVDGRSHSGFVSAAQLAAVIHKEEPELQTTVVASPRVLAHAKRTLVAVSAASTSHLAVFYVHSSAGRTFQLNVNDRGPTLITQPEPVAASR